MPIENVASQFLSRMPDPAGNLAQGYARGTALGQRDRALDQEQGKINFAQNAAQASTAQQQADEALKRTSALALMALADPSGKYIKGNPVQGWLAKHPDKSSIDGTGSRRTRPGEVRPMATETGGSPHGQELAARR